MRKEEVIEVMSKYGFKEENIVTTGETFQIGYWKYPSKNKKGESITLEVDYCHNVKSPRCLPVLWHKAGYTDRLILNYWSIGTYVRDAEGSCWRKYDFTKLSEDGKRRVIDFDWILEPTVENLEKMVTEVLRRFNA